MAVKVNGEIIEDAQINQEAQQIKAYYQQRGQGNIDEDKIYEVAKENAVKRQLLMQEAREKDIEVTEEDIDREYKNIKQRYGNNLQNVSKEDMKEDIKDKIRYDYLLDEIVEDVEDPDEEEVKGLYQEHEEHFQKPEQVHAAHIVKQVNSKEEQQQVKSEMEDIKEKLDQGQSFEKIADKHSDCNDNGGDLGFFARGQMVQNFEDVVFKMDPGEISDVFLTQFGYHIAKVYEKKDSEQMSYEEAKEHIEDNLINRNKAQAVEEYVTDLKEEAEIEQAN